MVRMGLMIKVAFTQTLRYPCAMNVTLRLGRTNAHTLYYWKAVEIG